MSRVALGLAYDGSAWQGWQTQPHRQTVQDTLESALGRFCGVAGPVPTICAGRTDTGVHGAMQVVHLDTSLDRRMESWVRGVNAFLPSSISVQWAQPVSDEFHARFSARARTYVYLLWRGRVRPALWAGRAGWCFQPLDVDAMRAAAQTLVGEHDFSSFRSSQCQAKHPVRHMHGLDIEERGPFLVFTLKANAFLHHMVRNIAGVLMTIGAGERPVEWMKEVLESRERRSGGVTAHPYGLYLVQVEYHDEFPLPERFIGPHFLTGFSELDG